MSTKLPLWVMAPEQEQVISSPPGLMTRMACTWSKGSISKIAWGTCNADTNCQCKVMGDGGTHSTQQPSRLLLRQVPVPALSTTWRPSQFKASQSAHPSAAPLPAVCISFSLATSRGCNWACAGCASHGAPKRY